MIRLGHLDGYSTGFFLPPMHAHILKFTCVCTQVIVYLWRSEINFLESIHSFQHVDLWNWAKVIMLDDKNLSLLLSHQGGPLLCSFFILLFTSKLLLFSSLLDSFYFWISTTLPCSQCKICTSNILEEVSILFTSSHSLLIHLLYVSNCVSFCFILLSYSFCRK